MLASEQSPQKTPLRCRSTSSARHGVEQPRPVRRAASGGIRMSSRRYCQEPIEVAGHAGARSSKSGWITSPAGRTAASARSPPAGAARRTRARRSAAGSSLSAHSSPSASTNRTRCRLGPTGMSRSGTSGTVPVGQRVGPRAAPAVPGDGARSRSSGAAIAVPGPRLGRWSLRGARSTLGHARRASARRVTREVVAGRGSNTCIRSASSHSVALSPSTDPARRVERHARSGVRSCSLSSSRCQLGQLSGDLSGRLERHERVLLVAQPLDDVDRRRRR